MDRWILINGPAGTICSYIEMVHYVHATDSTDFTDNSVVKIQQFAPSGSFVTMKQSNKIIETVSLDSGYTMKNDCIAVHSYLTWIDQTINDVV